jgi:hypothetical protein
MEDSELLELRETRGKSYLAIQALALCHRRSSELNGRGPGLNIRGRGAATGVAAVE